MTPWIVAALLAAAPAPAAPAAPKISAATQECIDCHQDATPGIVADWRRSRHSTTTPAQGLAKPALERRVSTESVPAELRDVAVGCYECHTRNATAHTDNFTHEGYKINVIVTPPDCATCHGTEVEEYSHSKKAHAVGNLKSNPVYSALVETVIGPQKVDAKGKLAPQPSSAHTQGKTCFACHGTEVKVEGKRTIEVDGTEYKVPALTNWPNHGVGRINPDGSRGACTACHPRHNFSIEVARKPQSCSQCHLSPDTPAWEVYTESKHGNIALSLGEQWNWTAVPWKLGTDFAAPTCAVCHNALVTTPGGQVVAKRTHDFGARLWVRIFGLPFTHPQPVTGATYVLRNADNQPLAVTFGGKPAAAGLIDADEQAGRLAAMQGICRGCHGTDLAAGYFAQFQGAIDDTEIMTNSATVVLQQAWKAKKADPKNPFDEPLEKKWVKQWLFYGNSVRYGAAMGGPDYTAFKYGWWDLSENLREMQAH
jgi:hypothetical protein